MPTFNFTTGPATLPDVGILSYNGCVFSPLFETEVSCAYVKDEAARTTKYIEYTISVDGYVTLAAGEANIQSTFATLERLLSAPGGALLYSGRSIKIAVNTAGGDGDVAWGPIPEIIDITPMGGGLSAQIKWTIKARVPPRVPVRARQPVLQFNYETSVTYDEAGYSTMRISGTTEIPMTRTSVTDRAVTSTADDFRNRFPGELLATIDLTKFRVVSRDFKVSRDKRTLTFDVQVEELPWMAMPPDTTIARGQFTFRPAKSGMGLANWLCTLSVTYTIPKELPRRIAWFAFLALLRLRMAQGPLHGSVTEPAGEQNPVVNLGINVGVGVGIGLTGTTLIARWRQMLLQQGQPGALRNVMLIDLNGAEGVHLDSKTVTFSATWRLVTKFSEILLASGLWKKVPAQNENAWATSVRSISGHQSWLRNRPDPSLDAIVDFGY